MAQADLDIDVSRAPCMDIVGVKTAVKLGDEGGGDGNEIFPPGRV